MFLYAWCFNPVTFSHLRKSLKQSGVATICAMSPPSWCEPRRSYTPPPHPSLPPSLHSEEGFSFSHRSRLNKHCSWSLFTGRGYRGSDTALLTFMEGLCNRTPPAERSAASDRQLNRPFTEAPPFKIPPWEKSHRGFCGAN